MRALTFGIYWVLVSVAAATPPGFVKSTILLNAPPVGLAFDADGALYALEGAAFNSNDGTLRVFAPDGTPGASFPIEGSDPTNFFVGGMAYDPVGEQLLISDNTADGRLYTVSTTGVQATLSTGLAGIAGIAVRDSGEIYVTTAPFGSPGAVLQIDRTTGDATEVLGELAFGAGLAFDGDDMIVQDAYLISAFETRGRLRRLGEAEPFLDDMLSGYAVIVDEEGDIFTTGSGGLYEVKGTPLAEVSWLASGFSAAMAFDPGPFEKFGGPGGGRLALAADAFGAENKLITLLTPAAPGDYNGDGFVNDDDYTVWRGAFDSGDEAADGDTSGTVDAADYILWRANAATASTATAVTSTHAIPEPGSLMLALFAAAAVCRSRHRRTS